MDNKLDSSGLRSSPTGRVGKKGEWIREKGEGSREDYSRLSSLPSPWSSNSFSFLPLLLPHSLVPSPLPRLMTLTWTLFADNETTPDHGP